MFQHISFDVEVVHDVDPNQLGWPGDRPEDVGFTGNRDFVDMRFLTWSDAEEALKEERQLVARVEATASTEDELDEILEELLEDPGYLEGLDIGVAAAVIALASSGNIPFSSCNGGAFGGHHHEWHPLIALYVRPGTYEELLKCAKTANVGFSNGSNAEAVIYAADIRAMLKFAELLITNRDLFSRPS
jgi:hypothetical protein